MRNAKKMGMGLVLAVILATAPLATAGPGPGRGGQQQAPGGGKAGAVMERRLQHLTTNLNLTKEQQDQIRPILAEEAARLEEIRAESSLSRVGRRAKLREIRDEVYGKIQPILTPEQQKKHDELRKQARERGSKIK